MFFFSSPKHDSLSQDGPGSVLTQDLNTAVSGGSLHVLVMGNIFQILRSVVGLISVFMINLMSIRDRTKKGLGNKCVDPSPYLFPFGSEGHQFVPFPHSLFHWPTFTKLQTNYVPKITDFIFSVETRYRFPYFFCHERIIMPIKEVVKYA